jgi:biopolymer transport protein ExbD
MPVTRSIRARKSRKKVPKEFELQLTSMMDILMIIVVFLLKTYATSLNNFSSVQGMKMPISISPEIPPDSLQVIVTPEGVTFENERIVDFKVDPSSLGTDEMSYAIEGSDLDEGGRRILPLYHALVKARESAELLRAKSSARDENGEPLPFDGILAIQADSRVNYDTVRRILYTAGAAGYRVFRFLAEKKET